LFCSQSRTANIEIFVTAVQFLAQVLMWPGAGLTMHAGKKRKVEFSHIWVWVIYCVFFD
jgi:hypothetical protein